LINDFSSYFFFVIPTDLFLNLNIQIILLALPFLAILSCWIYLLANSLRSYYIFKSTSFKKTLVNNSNYESADIFPYVSVIVPARNEQDNIERCLLSLIEQNYPNFELIVVDDNSTDNTLTNMKKIQQKYHHYHQKQKQKKYPILKIVELKDKPDDWTGKTWASEQGYLKSTGNILLFTDADTIYKKNVISYVISYMISNKLDVITGDPFIELRDFWSKISMPLWKLMSFTLGKDVKDINNPKSKIALLMGCFIMIKRNVFESIGTFKSVKNAIQEDQALGVRIKESGYKLRMIPMDNFIRALWSRDLSTLWQGIGRTIAPMILKEKEKVFINFISIIFMTTLPHMLLLYTIYLNLIYSNTFAMTNTIHIFDNYYYTLFIFNLIVCLTSLVGIYIKTVKTYKINPLYTLLSPIGSIFLIIAYLSTIIPFLLSSKSIEWKGRTFAYKKNDNQII
jgi:chlorobactene glucosyltransferase